MLKQSNTLNPLLLTGAGLLVPALALWAAVFSAALKIPFLGELARPLLDNILKIGEMTILVVCPLATSILGFFTYQKETFAMPIRKGVQL
jgi:hypothetical protein